MNVFFDVDYTIVDSEGELLRPHVKEVFQQLVDDGHSIYLWSGMGLRWEVVNGHGLESLVQNCFEKPLWNHEKQLAELGVSCRPDYVVDDTPGIVSVFGGFVIPPFSPWTNPQDSEMLRVYDAIKQYSEENGIGA